MKIYSSLKVEGSQEKGDKQLTFSRDVVKRDASLSVLSHVIKPNVTGGVFLTTMMFPTSFIYKIELNGGKSYNVLKKIVYLHGKN